MNLIVLTSHSWIDQICIDQHELVETLAPGNLNVVQLDLSALAMVKVMK